MQLRTQAIKAALRETFGGRVADRFDVEAEFIGPRAPELELALLRALGWEQPEAARDLTISRVDQVHEGVLYPVDPARLAASRGLAITVELDFAAALLAPLAIGAQVGPQDGLAYGLIEVEHVHGDAFCASATFTVTTGDGPQTFQATYGAPERAYSASTVEKIHGHALYRAGEISRAAPLASGSLN